MNDLEHTPATHQGGTPLTSSPELTIAVVVPVYNGGESFRACLKSLAALDPPPNEFIVVSDGDTDGSWQLAEQYGARVIRLPVSNGGPARPRNIGVAQAVSDLIYFVDADVCVPPDTLQKVADAFRRHPGLTALIGSYDDTPAAPNFLSQYKNLQHHYVHQNGQTEASTFWGACGAIRRQVFLEFGGFDESYRRPSIEDIELGYRLKKAGHHILLCKEITVKHLKRWEVGSLLKADFFYRAIPWTELILRDRMFLNDLNIGHSERLCVVLAYALVGSLLGAFWWWPSLVISVLIMAALLAINAPFYRFFLKKRGFRFALQCLPWHWLYYLYGGLAFGIGFVRHAVWGTNTPMTRPSLVPEAPPAVRKPGNP